MTRPDTSEAGAVSTQSRAAEDAVVILEEIETAINVYGAKEYAAGYDAERGGPDDPDAAMKAEGDLKRLIAAALAAPPSAPASVSGQPAPVVPDEVRRLQEEVAYWRRDLAARLWSLTALYEAAKERGEPERAADLACLLYPILASYDSAMAGEWYSRCDICGEFIRDDEPRLHGEDISGHARCVSDDGEGDVDPHGDDELARRAEAARAVLSAPWPDDEALAATPSRRADTPLGGVVPEGWRLVPERATREMIHVMRYGAHDAKLIAIGQKPEPGETPWPRFGEPLAQEAYQAALSATPAAPEPAAGGERETQQRADILLALEAALALLSRYEPGDSRAVSDEFVAMASAVAGCMNDDGRQILLSIIAGPAPRSILSTPSEAGAAGEGWVERCARAAQSHLEMLRSIWPTVHPERGDGLSPAHLLFMAEELAKGRVGSETKSCRWLGWLQSCLVSRGFLSLEMCKEINLATAPLPAKPRADAPVGGA